MAVSYIPRVTQLDAIQLDSQVEELFKQFVFHATTFFEPGLLQPVLPELELLLRTWIFKYSVWDQKLTFGQQMLELKYSQNNFVRSKLYWYFVYTVVLKYLQDRAMYSYTANTKVQQFIQTLETFQVFCDIFNFIRFIQSGKYPRLIDFVLGLELTADKLTREDLSDFSWTREILWHNLIELFGTTISLMNIFGLRSKISGVLKYVWWRNNQTVRELSSPSMTIHTVCACCSNNPVLPHTMGCSHVFCYYCLVANKTADQDYVCPQCFFNGKEINRYSQEQTIRKTEIIV